MATQNMTTHQHLLMHREKTHTNWAVKDGIAGGIVAGIVFALVQMVWSWITTGSFILPLQMIAGIVLQQAPGTVDMGTAFVAGGLLHLAYSAVFGIVVALIVASSEALYKSKSRIVLFSAVAAFVMWIVNFYIVTPLLNAPWFAIQTNPLAQFLIHTLALGAVLGYYLDATPPKDEVGRGTRTDYTRERTM